MRMGGPRGGGGSASPTGEPLNAVEFSEQLINDSVGDAGAVVPPLRRYAVELVEEQHARRRRRRPPAVSVGHNGLAQILTTAPGCEW